MPPPSGWAHVLLIRPGADDADGVREGLAAHRSPSLHVTHLDSLDAAVSVLANASVDALVLDLPLEGQGLRAAYHRLRAAAPHAAIVLCAPLDQEAIAAQAVHEGADDYVLKGQSDGRVLASTVGHALRRARAEAELREEQHQHRILLDVLDDGVAWLDANGGIIEANPSMARMLGYERPHELTGISLGGVYAGPGRADALLERLTTDAGTLPRAEAELLSRDGGRLTVLLRARALKPRTDRPAVCEIICTNITTERRLEHEARQDEQLVIGGTLAGGLGFDLQRLISTTAATHDLLAEAIGQDHPRHQDLQHLRDTTATAARLTEELLAATRRRGARPAVLEAATLLERLCPSLQQTVGGEVAVRLPPAGTAAGQITTPAGEIDHVILELASIAGTLEPQGMVTITTAPVYLDATYAREHLALVPGHYVVFVTTTSTQSLETLTAPDWQAERYFSPEAAERHVALELATIYRMVNQNGGHFAIRRTAGGGTTFKVYMPRVDCPGRLGTILLVEDEPSIRCGGRQLLELLDYRVLEAGDPHEAIWLASRFGETIDLLIADVVLPGMSGAEMAKRLLAGQYVSKVLYMSGLLKETLVGRAALPPDATFIEKPFTARELATRVAEVLGGRA